MHWFVAHEADDDVGLWVHVSHGANCASQAQWGDPRPVDAAPPPIAAAIARHSTALAHERRAPPRPPKRADSDSDSSS